MLGAAGLALLIAGFYTVVRWRGDRAWREYAAQSAARGEMLDALPGPSTLPPERNFMKAPVLDRWLFGPFNDPHLEQFRFPGHEAGFSRAALMAQHPPVPRCLDQIAGKKPLLLSVFTPRDSSRGFQPVGSASPDCSISGYHFLMQSGHIPCENLASECFWT
jgi:hypothetical protein